MRGCKRRDSSTCAASLGACDAARYHRGMSLSSSAVGVTLGVTVVGAFAGTARADDSNKQRSHFTVAFGGGVLLPNGSMKDGTDASLDVGSRIGWTGTSGFGVVTNLEYAPLSHQGALGVLETI